MLASEIKAKKCFVHYFENGARRYSEEGGKRISKEASPHVDHVLTCRKDDLGDEFLVKFSTHLETLKGGGYWCWKPRCILLALESMRNGDMLVYADTGCEIRSSLEPMFALLCEQDVVCFHLNQYQERFYTKRDLFVALDCDVPEITDTPHRLATYLLLRKTPKSVALIEEWLTAAHNLHLIDDTPSKTPSYPEFREHRHDQSIW